MWVHPNAARHRRRRERGTEDERGATLVEFALLAPIFCTLLFGIIDFGLVMRDVIGANQGTREGARQGIVGTLPPDSCSLVGASAANDSTRNLMCLTKDRTGLGDAKVRVKIVLGSGGYEKGEPLLVCVATPLVSTTRWYSPVLDGRTHLSEVKMRIEDTAEPPIVSAAETPPAGSDWSRCTI